MFDSFRNLFSRSATPAEPASPPEPAPLQLRADGLPDFPVAAHLVSAQGLPLLDWEAAHAWSGQAGDDAAIDAAWSACERAWLLHLRDALGPSFALTDSGQVLLLSSLAPREAAAATDFVQRSVDRILHLLEGVAEVPPFGNDIVIVFDDEDSYYRYISHYYPEEGEFGFSGGMYISAGCGHFVTRKADLAALEPVIVHELTHSMVAHLPLPAWLNEGLAVNTERKLAGASASLYSPQELRAMHLDFWDASTLQEFWSGDAFARSDDGQLLAYDLARIMVEQLARDWPAFREFVRAADHRDAGAAAARTHLGMTPGHAAAALLELPADPCWEPAPARWRQEAGQ